MWLATILGILFGMVCGVFIDAVIFRRGRHVNLAGKQIITMGLVSVIANLIPMIYYYVDTPRIPSFLDIGLWPIFMGFTMWFQQKLNPAPTNSEQAKMFALMPVFFTFMLGQFASGLVIYWTLSNLLSIIQQRLIMKKNGVN